MRENLDTAESKGVCTLDRLIAYEWSLSKRMSFVTVWTVFKISWSFVPASKRKTAAPTPRNQQALKLVENLQSQHCLWYFKHPSHHDLKTDVGVSSKKPGLSKDSVKQSYDTLRHRFRKVSSSRSVSWSYYWYYEQLFVSNISYLCSVNKYKGYQFYAKKGSGSFKLIYRSEIYKISTLLHFTCIYTQIA